MKQKRKNPSINQYSGWPHSSHLHASDQHASLPKIKATIKPETFWQDHVSQRKPAILQGHPPGLDHLASLWSNAHLANAAVGCFLLLCFTVPFDVCIDLHCQCKILCFVSTFKFMIRLSLPNILTFF